MDFFIVAAVTAYVVMRIYLHMEQIEAINDLREALDDLTYMEVSHGDFKRKRCGNCDERKIRRIIESGEESVGLRRDSDE